MEKRSTQFGRLLKAGIAAVAYLEGKTQRAIEDELGELLGVAGVTLQRYKAGHIPPSPDSAEQLAEACVRRGLLGAIWLDRFLEAARYPAAGRRALAARLLPERPAPRPSVVRPNLPPPTYTRFIMRPTSYEQVLAGLISALPLTLIVGLGGLGKTSLARVVAASCLSGSDGAPRFDSVVWVSDQDHPGATNLSTTLDAIARVLDYPGLLALSFSDRLREVDQLLRQHQLLVVLDSAETVSDGALLEWIGRVPPPSKALVTSRFALDAFDQAYTVALEPMGQGEVRALIGEWLPRSRLRSVPGAIDQLLPIAALAGGNAKAIELTLGQLQHRTRDEVAAALAGAGHYMFDELITQAWTMLDRPAQGVLLALPLFPSSTTADALIYCAGLSPTVTQRVMSQLTALSLIDIERDHLDAPPRYNAHPIVRSYARGRASDLPAPEQSAIRGRWLQWCVELAASVGFCWNDLDRLDLLDREYALIQAAIDWAAEQNMSQELIALVEGVRYYCNVRGLWGDAQLRYHDLRVLAARRLGDADNEAIALAHHIQILSKQGRLGEAAPLVERLTSIGAERYPLDGTAATAAQTFRRAAPRPIGADAAFEYHHANGLYALASGDLGAAEAVWRRLLDLARILGGQKYIVNRRWLATVLLGREQIDAAQQLYADSLEDARQIQDVRTISGNLLKLAAIDMRRLQMADAAIAVDEARRIASRFRDRRRLAECHRASAQIREHAGQRQLALDELRAALDLFERLGMRRDAAECSATIDRLAEMVQIH